MDQANQINGVTIQKYDVVETSLDGGKNWLDYSSIKDSNDVRYARQLVNEGGDEIQGGRRYRIARNGTVIVEKTVLTPDDLVLAKKAVAYAICVGMEDIRLDYAISEDKLVALLNKLEKLTPEKTT